PDRRATQVDRTSTKGCGPTTAIIVQSKASPVLRERTANMARCEQGYLCDVCGRDVASELAGPVAMLMASHPSDVRLAELRTGGPREIAMPVATTPVYGRVTRRRGQLGCRSG